MPEEQGKEQGIPGDVGYKRPPADTRFKPGQSGNPGGRPKGRSLTSILRELLDRNEIRGFQLKEGQTVADALVEAMVAEAIKGNAAVIKLLYDRIDGKAGEVKPTRTLDEIAAEARAAAEEYRPDARPK